MSLIHTLDEQSEPERAIRLRKLYPLAKRTILYRSFPAVLFGVLAAVVGTYFPNVVPEGSEGRMYYDFLFTVVAFGVLVAILVAVLKVFYEILYHIFYVYNIEGDHLVVSRGIFIKNRASTPLAKITDVYVERNLLELIFCIYDVEVLTPSRSNPNLRVNGLGTRAAVGLQNYILTEVEKVLPGPTEEPEEKRMSNVVDAA